jgi:toxin FitB
MIILDTNVVSEALKPEPHRTVLAWLNHQVAETLFLSSATQALGGLLRLFRDRVLPFDTDAARR